MENTAEQIVNFMRVLEKVSLVKRDNLMYEGTKETDGFHIFKLTFLVMMIYPYLKTKVDYAKMLELALVHDIAEGITGDYPLAAQLKNPRLKSQKKLKELEAMNYYRSILPSPLNAKIFDLFIEYEQRSSVEAKIVSSLDKLEANLQANQFNDGDVRYWSACDCGEIYYNIAQEYKPLVAELNEEIISQIEDTIVKRSKENIKKCKKQT